MSSKKSLFTNLSPGNISFNENHNRYDRSYTGRFKGKNSPFRSNNDLKILSKEDSIFEDDYRLDGPGVGVRSTQQINIDYELFENHVFFDSAVSKINIAFDKIVNEFPFDQSESDLNEFRQGLTGYEKFILDSFSKNRGYLNFSGSALGEHSGAGQYIQIEDSAGRLFPSFSSRNDLAPVLSPKSSPFTIEFFARVPEQINGNQSIFQLKKSDQSGISISLSSSADITKCNVVFDISSGSLHNFVSASLDKGKFNHIACVYSFFENDKSGLTSMYVDGILQNTSSISLEIENFNLNFQNSKAFIGSGSSIQTKNADSSISHGIFIPQQTFSGSIDEFRFYHSERTEKQINESMFKNVFGGKDSRLVAYYRFNEPSGSYNIPDVCLDASSNSLHAKIINHTHEIRNTGSIGSSPVKQELLEDNPVLYPEFFENNNLHTRLINSASLYDESNPNLITNLIPVHYFLEGNEFEGLQNFTGSYGSAYKSQNIPKSGKVGSGQLLMSFLFLWAKYFDEIKIYIDTLSRILSYGYDLQEVAVEKFLPHIGRYYGIDLPGIFARASQRQYNTRAGINDLGTLSTYSLYEVQNKIWRQILANLNSLRQEKGTMSSVKGIIRTLGVEPDSIFDIREYGGPKAFYLDGRRKNIKKNYQMLDFSGSLAKVSENLDAHGFSTNKPHIVGSYLSGSRIEVGFPEVNISNATATVTVGGNATLALLDAKTLTIKDSNGLQKVYVFDKDNDGATGTLDGSDNVRIQINGIADTTAGRKLMATQVETAIKHANGHNGSITVAKVDNILTLTQPVGLNDGNNIVATTAADATHLAVSGFSGGAGYLEGPNPPHGISFSKSDGLFTSGSFSVEGIFQFPVSRKYPQYQSLVRLNSTGSVGKQNNLLSNIVVKKNNTDVDSLDDTATIFFYNNSNKANNESGALHVLEIHSASIFDGRHWYINFGFTHGDDPYTQDTIQASSSFFLRCISESGAFLTSSLANKRYYGESSDENNVFSAYDVNRNTSGSFITIGSQSIATSENRFLNNPTYSYDLRTSDFSGKVNFLRFWSKGTTEEEARERGRNLRSLGVELPKSQYNHSQELTGAFNRLRVDAKIGIQSVTGSNNVGDISISDFSQNNLFFAGSGFESNKLVLKNELFMFSSLTPKFDIRASDIKVRVRSYLQKENIESDPFAKAAPVFNLDDEFPPEDDNRFSVDLSVVKALDEDIMKMMSSLQSFDNALGDPRDLFEDSYVDLENLRKVYFNDLVEKLNLSSYSEFFTWFDMAFTELIGEFLPLRANFLGVNHVVESHVLERHKAKYFYDDQYLMNRPNTRDTYGNN